MTYQLLDLRLCGEIYLNVRVWVTRRTIKTVRFGARRYWYRHIGPTTERSYKVRSNGNFSPAIEGCVDLRYARNSRM